MNFKILIYILIILAVIIIALAVFLLWPVKKAIDNKGFYGDKNTIQVLLLNPNQEISSPFPINGKVNGNGWVGFEGQVGTVKLLDNAGKELALGILTATTEWTTLPTYFETTLNFQSALDLPGTLVFHNENPSGDPLKDKTFIVPVNVKASSETMTVKLYFLPPNSGKNPITCTETKEVERVVPKTQAPATAALEELLKGPTLQDSAYTGINEGVKLKNLNIKNGTAYADFDETLEKGVGGSCTVTIIRTQIEKTLKQFSTIKNVIISINGRTEDILQP